MPALSPPLTFFCPSCGWKKTFPFATGDVRIKGINHFDACPQCSSPIDSRHANAVELLTAQVSHLIRKR